MATQTGHKILGRNDLGGLGSLYCDGKSMEKLYQNRFSSRLFVATITLRIPGHRTGPNKKRLFGGSGSLLPSVYGYEMCVCVCVCGLQANLEANAA